jgi:hypothetical protein
MRFAVPHDRRLADLVRLLDQDEVPIAQTWRAVGEGAERLGLARPGYGLVRQLVRSERHRRQLRAATIAALKDAAHGFAAGRVPVEKLIDDLERIGLEEELVLNEHKPPSRAQLRRSAS